MKINRALSRTRSTITDVCKLCHWAYSTRIIFILLGFIKAAGFIFYFIEMKMSLVALGMSPLHVLGLVISLMLVQKADTDTGLIFLFSLPEIFTASKRSCGRVIFSQARFIHSVHKGGGGGGGRICVWEGVLAWGEFS